MTKELKYALGRILSDSIKKAIEDGCLKGIDFIFKEHDETHLRLYSVSVKLFLN